MRLVPRLVVGTALAVIVPAPGCGRGETPPAAPGPQQPGSGTVCANACLSADADCQRACVEEIPEGASKDDEPCATRCSGALAKCTAACR